MLLLLLHAKGSSFSGPLPFISRRVAAGQIVNRPRPSGQERTRAVPSGQESTTEVSHGT